MQTKLIFDAFLQKDVPHTIGLNPNGNGEIIFTSIEPLKVEEIIDGKSVITDSYHFLKFAPGTAPEEVNAYVAKYKEQNTGKVSVVEYQKKEAEAVAQFADPA